MYVGEADGMKDKYSARVGNHRKCLKLRNSMEINTESAKWIKWLLLESRNERGKGGLFFHKPCKTSCPYNFGYKNTTSKKRHITHFKFYVMCILPFKKMPVRKESSSIEMKIITGWKRSLQKGKTDNHPQHLNGVPRM